MILREIFVYIIKDEMAINITTDIYRNLLPSATLTLSVKGRYGNAEEARSITSYAYGGLINHPTERKQIMMENARIAMEKAEQKYSEQFNQMIQTSLKNVLRQKYQMTPYKKSLLQTGSKNIRYEIDDMPELPSNFIGEFLMKLRDRFRREELENLSEKNQILRRYRMQYLSMMVYTKLKSLIENGDNLVIYNGKSLSHIAKMLGIDVHLSVRQQNALDTLHLKRSNAQPRPFPNVGNVGNVQDDYVKPSSEFLRTNYHSIDNIKIINDITYRMHGEDKNLPAGSIINCRISHYTTPQIVMVQPYHATTKSGGRLMFAQTSNIEMSIDNILVHRKLIKEQPLDEQVRTPLVDGTHTRTVKPVKPKPLDRTQTRPPPSDFTAFNEKRFFQQTAPVQNRNVQTGQSEKNVLFAVPFADPFADRDIEFLANQNYQEKDISIIPFFLQVRYYEPSTMNREDICKLFATHVLNEKQIANETEAEQLEFNRQINQFCSYASKSIREQIYAKFKRREAPFNNLNESDVEKKIFDVGIEPDIESLKNADIKEIVRVFNEKYLFNNEITRDDIMNMTEGDMSIDDNDIHNINSCHYILNQPNKSVWFYALRKVLRLFPNIPNNKIVINSVRDLYEMNKRQIVQKRLRKAVSIIYDGNTQEYTKWKRLLVTTGDNRLVYQNQEFADLLMSARQSLIGKVQPLSGEELKSEKKQHEFPPMSYHDKMWLKNQYLDIAMSIRYFSEYLSKKAKNVAGTVQLKHTMFVVNLYAKCFDSIAIEIDDKFESEISDEFRQEIEAVVNIGTDSLKYLWAYTLKLYEGLLLLRSKLANTGVALTDPQKANRISDMIADRFIETDKRLAGVIVDSSSPDARLINMMGITFETIVTNLQQFWSRNRIGHKLETHEFEFAYKLLSRMDNVNISESNISVRQFVSRLAEKWPRCCSDVQQLSTFLGGVMNLLTNLKGVNIKSRLYYFANLDILEDKKEVKKDSDSDEDEAINEHDEDEHDKEGDNGDHVSEGHDYSDEEESDYFDEDNEDGGNEDDEF